MTLCRGHGLVFFYPLRGANSETSHDLQPGAHQGSSSSQIFSQLSILKVTAKVPPLELLRLNNLSCTKTAFLIPRWYFKHPHSFYMEVTSPWVVLVEFDCIHLLLYQYSALNFHPRAKYSDT